LSPRIIPAFATGIGRTTSAALGQSQARKQSESCSRGPLPLHVECGYTRGPRPARHRGERGHMVDDDARAETRDTWEEWFNANVIAQ